MAKNSPLTATAKFFPQRQIKTSPHPSCSACGHHSSHSALSSYGLFAPLTLWRLSVSLRSLVQTLESCSASGAPWSSAMAPSLERGRVINNIIQKTHILTQGWPTLRQNFLPHKHSFLFIAHNRVVVYLYFKVKTTPCSGVIFKKKKVIANVTILAAMMQLTFFFFWRLHLKWQKYCGYHLMQPRYDRELNLGVLLC